MDSVRDTVLSPLQLRNLTLPNRLIRSATYEGLADPDGFPLAELGALYAGLAAGGVGTIITGFAYISREGRAMHPAQCGIDSDDKISAWKQVVDRAREASLTTRLIMQIAHTGRQTKQRATGSQVVGASRKPCTYFKERTTPLDDTGIRTVVSQFADAAHRAMVAGFDGVQIHAAHGYLIHQFLSPWTNTRIDQWSNRALLLVEVILAIRRTCGPSFPILVKLSEAEDNAPGIRLPDTIETAKLLERLEIDAVEISYGTMENALNIIRGGVPIDVVLAVNPMFNRFPPAVKSIWKRLCYPAYARKLIPFAEDYNLDAAARVKREAGIPVIAVGGIRSLRSINKIISEGLADAVALCRPLVCEPELPSQIANGEFIRSRCVNCNLCTIYCDSNWPLRCYHKKGTDL